ncbi:hypothetical protein ACER0A_005365 [Haloimpatiens sp. FM7315]|uniref:hypothetical protein n=1 Tax=Haloimpatiens sp. FM7315 TaxID=3298609 RepID=UPI0035A279E4
MEKKSKLFMGIKLIMCRLRENHVKESCNTNKELIPADNKWSFSTENELLIREVLNPLLNIIFLYKESDGYNYVPGTKDDVDAGWNYFEKKFNNIYRALDQNLYISNNTYLKVIKIIEEIQAFVRSFSYVEGLPERYFDINPNLKFYRVGFFIKDEDPKAYKYAVTNDMISYVPLETEFITREEYFSNKRRMDKELNFKHDEDDFFMEELAYTIRLVFLNDLTEYAA